MTEYEFVEWTRDEANAEWVDGEVILKMPISRAHDALQFWLRLLITEFVQKRKLGEVCGPQFTIRLPHRPSRRDPDVMFVANERLHLLGNTFMDGPSDLAIEVVLPESIQRDYHEKYFEYEGAGVREYWIVDPLSQTVSLFTLSAAGKYEKIEPVNGRLNSVVLPGLWINNTDPFKNPLPEVQALLAEMNV
jgi:Uma2 family endonuclease